MADNYLAKVPGSKMAESERNILQDVWDEAKGAFARYGRRSGAQRDASLALLNQAADPNTDPFTGAGMKALGLAGLITHPLAFFPTGDEWRERLSNAGNTSRMGQAIGGFLGDLPSLIDPQMVAGGAATVAPAIFAGVMAKTANLEKLREAERLADAGVSPDTIWKTTGWGKGADGKWRFEIDDSKAQHLGNLAQEGPLSSFIKHDDLFAAYPDMANMKVTQGVNLDGADAAYAPGSDQMYLGNPLMGTPERRLSEILHEGQHGVQSREGFARGGMPSEFSSPFPQAFIEKAAALRETIDTVGQERAAKLFEDFYGHAPSTELYNFANSTPLNKLAQMRDPMESYMRLAGEVEARNVQSRGLYSAEARLNSPPWLDESRKRSEQDVRFWGQ